MITCIAKGHPPAVPVERTIYIMSTATPQSIQVMLAVSRFSFMNFCVGHPVAVNNATCVQGGSVGKPD